MLDWRVEMVRMDMFPELDELMAENECKDREELQALEQVFL